MRNLLIFSIFTCVQLIISCKIHKKETSDRGKLSVHEQIIPPNMYLSKRMPDCNLAFAYMDSVILPSKPTIGYVNSRPKVVLGTFEILNDTINTFESNKHLYYISPNCFVGLPSKFVFKVFCPESSFGELMHADSLNTASNATWPISLTTYNKVGMGFTIENGVVVSSSINKSYVESH